VQPGDLVSALHVLHGDLEERPCPARAIRWPISISASWGRSPTRLRHCGLRASPTKSSGAHCGARVYGCAGGKRTCGAGHARPSVRGVRRLLAGWQAPPVFERPGCRAAGRGRPAPLMGSDDEPCCKH
jgi:hypothetical protein